MLVRATGTDPGLGDARFDASWKHRPPMLRRALTHVPNLAARALDLDARRTDGTGPYESADQ